MIIYSEQDFNEFSADIAGAYKFPLDDQFYEAVATVILHAPPDMGDLDPEYVAERVGKMMANKVAYEKIQEIKQKREDTAKAAQAAEVSSNGSESLSHKEV